MKNLMNKLQYIKDDYLLYKIKLLPHELEDYIYSYIKDDYTIKLKFIKTKYNLFDCFQCFRFYGYHKYLLDIFYEVFPTDDTSFPLFLCEYDGFIEDKSNYSIISKILFDRIKEIESKNEIEPIYKIYRTYIILSNKLDKMYNKNYTNTKILT
jgi:hypothetical protein